MINNQIASYYPAKANYQTSIKPAQNNVFQAADKTVGFKGIRPDVFEREANVIMTNLSKDVRRRVANVFLEGFLSETFLGSFKVTNKKMTDFLVDKGSSDFIRVKYGDFELRTQENARTALKEFIIPHAFKKLFPGKKIARDTKKINLNKEARGRIIDMINSSKNYSELKLLLSNLQPSSKYYPGLWT